MREKVSECIIVLMKNDPLVKGIIDAVGGMLDARFKTWEVNFKSYVKAEIRATEARIRKDMATKDDIKELKEGLGRIEKKLDKKTQADEKRFRAIEDELNIPRVNKN